MVQEPRRRRMTKSELKRSNDWKKPIDFFHCLEVGNADKLIIFQALESRSTL